MRTDDSVAIRIRKLVDEGQPLLRREDRLTKTRSQKGNANDISLSDRSRLYSRWETSCLQLLKDLEGIIGQEFYKQFTRDDSRNPQSQFFISERRMGVLEAALQDYENGALLRFQLYVRVDLLGDFLDQARFQLSQKSLGPAMVYAGCALEDTLRTLCILNKIQISDKPQANSMISSLATKGVLTKSDAHRIRAITAHRNDAAHGKHGGLAALDVEHDIEFLQAFIQRTKQPFPTQ